MAGDVPCDASAFTQGVVSPRIIQDLEGWISDGGEQVVAINLNEAIGTNRYFGEFGSERSTGGDSDTILTMAPRSCQDGTCDDPASFSYQWVGSTSRGIHVLRTALNSGGTGVFESLLLVTLVFDQGFSYDADNKSLTAGRQRCLIKRMGSIPLGDRYDGKVSLHGDTLHIGADDNPRGAGRFPNSARIVVPPPPDGTASQPGSGENKP
ncbi:MAG: hypothetical protein LBV50_10275 [Novosphingobium sp.]|jgi:hypothetical protein|nr:hypothetical protein [Novosphingobium sp.]